MAGRKPAAKKAEEKKDEKASFGYFQNSEGRVFVGTAEIHKQAKKNKFGLMKIHKSVYEEAMKAGGLTDPLPEVEDDEEDI